MNRDPKAWARLGRGLREARERRGWTQGELAERAGVSIGSVQAREAGEVPKKRMPYALPPIADVLGWPNGAVDAVLAGADPPGGQRWVDRPAEVDPGQVAAVAIHDAMVRSLDTATTAEIRKATRIALDELRRQGVLPETNETQPN